MYNLKEIIKEQDATIKLNSNKIEYLVKRINQLELKMELQTCVINVASRVSEELHHQLENMKLKQTDKLVLKDIPIQQDEKEET